jgi:hypothetical protein
VRGIAIGLLLAVAIWACAAPAPVTTPNDRYNLLTQQTALWTQIRDWRREAGLRVDPPAELLQEFRGRSLKEAQRVCPDTHPITKTCEDICSLADAICDNAEAICDIAAKLGKDDHQAQEKCTSAKASCREAKQRCCTKCSEEPGQ